MAGDLKAFRRDPGAPFDELKKEKFAQSRAKGATIRAASNASEINYQTGMVWERAEEMQKRVKELRQNAEDYVGVSVSWILNELKTNAKMARDEGQLKSSNEAYKLIYDIVTKDPTLSNNAARAIPANASMKDIKRELMRSLTEGAHDDEAIDTESEDVA